MPNIIQATTEFSNGDQVTAAALNNLVADASFQAGALAGGVGAPSGLTLDTGKLKLADVGVTTARLASGAVTAEKITAGEITNTEISATAGIALSKLANISATNKILGRVASGAGAIEEVALIVADDLTGASDENLVSTDAIKNYVDRYRAVYLSTPVPVFDGKVTVNDTYEDIDLVGTTGTNADRYFVTLRVTANVEGSTENVVHFRTKGDTVVYSTTASVSTGYGASSVWVDEGVPLSGGYVYVWTDDSANRAIQVASPTTGLDFKVELVAYQGAADV